MTSITANTIRAVCRSMALFFLVCLGGIGQAKAYYLPLLFDPEQPVAGEVGQVIVRAGGCDGIGAGQMDSRILTVEGNVIRIEYIGSTDTVIFPGSCVRPLATSRFNLIPLDAGDYEVDLYRRIPVGDMRVDLMVSGTLTVVAAPALPPAHPIPALGPWLLALLAGVLGVFAMIRFRG